MRILVLSDTHIPVNATKLPPIIEEEAKKSDCCFHAGDFVSYGVFKQLTGLTKVHGVCGNMDDKSIRDHLPEKEIIKIGGFTCGIIHGYGSPSHLLEYIDHEFENMLSTLDIIIFGHSHCVCDKEIDGRIYFNPGSPTDTVFAPCRSYGILEIDGTAIKRRIEKIG